MIIELSVLTILKTEKLWKEYTISSSADAPKKFNFITSKSFEGVDFHSETGLCFVVSNVQNRHTLVSIDMDIPQIVGRIRTKSNPFRNKVVHIFNTKATDHYTTFEDMKLIVDEEVKAAQERQICLIMPSYQKQQSSNRLMRLRKLGLNLTYPIKRINLSLMICSQVAALQLLYCYCGLPIKTNH